MFWSLKSHHLLHQWNQNVQVALVVGFQEWNLMWTSLLEERVQDIISALMSDPQYFLLYVFCFAKYLNTLILYPLYTWN